MSLTVSITWQNAGEKAGGTTAKGRKPGEGRQGRGFGWELEGTPSCPCMSGL